MRTATFDDLLAVVAVGQACDLADLGELTVDEAWVHDEWVRPHFDPSADAWVVSDPSGKVVAFSYTWDEKELTVFDTAGWVHPAHRGLGIGTALVEAVETRAVRDTVSIPPDQPIRVLQSFESDASGARDPDASAARYLFEGLGYAPEREYLHMGIIVPEDFDIGGTPDGIEIRPRVAADDRAIVAVMAEVFDDPWNYEDARQEWFVSKTHDPTLWHVALHHDRIVGALFAHMINGQGQISALTVLEPWRRRGIGNALLRSSFAAFRGQGVFDVRLNVDRGNEAARRLYEQAGMQVRRRWIVFAKTLTRPPR
jgi:ribosomal protein S18 acetylase RimI-like enzyme